MKIEFTDFSLLVKNKITGEVIYKENGHWLDPLFHLKSFIEENNISTEDLILYDTKIGKAAASILYKLGINEIYIQELSKQAIPVLDKSSINYTFNKIVDRLKCKTEDLTKDINNLEELYNFVENYYNSIQEKK